MSSVKPESGMTYEFDVEGVFSFNNSITFLGKSSVDYLELFPVKAAIMVDNALYANINITADRMTNTPEKKSIVTYDKLDIEPIKNKKIVLHCTF